MARFCLYICFFIVIILETYLCNAQVPQRLQIPGAVLLERPQPQLQQRQQRVVYQDGGPVQRVRGGGGRPQIPLNALPVPSRESIRPVVEEQEDEIPAHQRQHHTASVSNFDQEAVRFGLTALTAGVQQIEDEPVQYRPSPTIPVLRQDLPAHVVSRPAPRPLPVRQHQEARPVIRQELKQEVFRPAPARQEYEREEIPVQVRRPAPQQIRQQPQQQQQPARHQAPQRVYPSRPAPQYLDEDDTTRKPVAQILRKYRTDNADGSITWGYENDDGSFKEETIGVDCITRGKYGYVDPDGMKREYAYETSGMCEEPEPEEEDLPQQQLQQRPQKSGQKPYRSPAQFAN